MNVPSVDLFDLFLVTLLVLILAVAGFLAAVLPMQRAASTEPLEALRTE